jgi:hypothetical protein
MLWILVPESLAMHRYSDKQLRIGRPRTRGHFLWNKLTKRNDASNRSTRSGKDVDGVPAEYDAKQQPWLARKQSKCVSFNLEANIIYHLSDPTHASIPTFDLWWSPKEIDSSIRNEKFVASVNESVREYCRAHERAQAQVHKDRKLSSANLAELMTGLSLGHHGLELYNAAATATHKLAVRNHVGSVIQCYRDNMNGGCSHGLDDWNTRNDLSHGSCGSNRSGNDHNATRHSSVERIVRNHSAKLSAGHRHFSAALGKADHMAAIWEDGRNPANSTATYTSAHQTN